MCRFIRNFQVTKEWTKGLKAVKAWYIYHRDFNCTDLKMLLAMLAASLFLLLSICI